MLSERNNFSIVAYDAQKEAVLEIAPEDINLPVQDFEFVYMNMLIDNSEGLQNFIAPAEEKRNHLE